MLAPYFVILILCSQVSSSYGQLGVYLVHGKKAFDDFFQTGLEAALESNWSHKAITLENVQQTVTSLVKDMRARPDSSRCLQSIQNIIDAAKNGEPWALRIFDSFGKMGNGFTDATIFWIGSYDLCINAIDKEEVPFQTKYCWTTWSHPITNLMTINMSICVPDTCTEEQLYDAISHFNPYFPHNFHFLQRSFANNLELDKVVCITDETNFWKNSFFITSILIIFILIGLIIVGTIIDYKDFRQQENKSKNNEKKNDNCFAAVLKNKSIKEDHYKKDDTVEESFKKFLVCFSVYTNAAKILNMKKQHTHNLACLNGLRVFSLAYVVFGHSVSFSLIGVDNFMYFAYVMRDFHFQFITSGVYAVDAFFVLSGLLVTYQYFKISEKLKINWFIFYIDRFLRITPVYWFSLFIIYMGIYIRLPAAATDFTKEQQREVCEESWPRYLVYFQNFGDLRKDCFGHTWYLANDMQFYLLSPIFLILMKRSKQVAIITLILTFIMSCGASFMAVEALNIDKLNVSNLNALNDFLNINFHLMADVYVKPYCRIGSYVVGMACGWFLYRTNCEFKFSKFQVIILWISSLIICVGIAFYPWYGSENSLQNKLYVSVCHNVWAVGLGIIIILCCCGYGGFVNTFLSWPGYFPVGQLSYSTYLIHGITLPTIFISINKLYHFSYSFLFLFAFGNFQLSLMAGFLLNIFVEAPALRLRDKYFSKKFMSFLRK